MLNIYVANLGAYVRGELVGEWIELPMEENELNEKLNGILKAGLSGDEELAIHDYETDLGISISEYESISDLNELAERIESLDTGDQEILKALLDVYSSDIKESLDVLESGNYIAYFDIENNYDLGYEVAHECGYITGSDSVLERYFDYESFGRDLTFDGYSIASNNIAILVQ